jgi:hypothetical protein
LKRIVILGCGGCANESLAFDKNLLQNVIFDEHMGHNMPAPDAITEEANRLKAVLGNMVEDIQTAVGMGLCSRTTGDRPEDWEKTCTNAEGVVALCCVAGMVGIKTLLGKNV